MNDVIIQKLVIDLKLKNWPDRDPVRINRMVEQKKQAILKMLEEVLNRNGDQFNALIDKIELNLDPVNNTEELLKNAESKLQAELSNYKRKNFTGPVNGSVKGSTGSAGETAGSNSLTISHILNYLDSGYFMWLQHRSYNIQEITDVLQANTPAAVSGLKELFIKNPAAIARFWGSFPGIAGAFFNPVFNTADNKAVHLLLEEILKSSTLTLAACPSVLYTQLANTLSPNTPAAGLQLSVAIVLTEILLHIKSVQNTGAVFESNAQAILQLLETVNVDEQIIAGLALYLQVPVKENGNKLANDQAKKTDGKKTDYDKADYNKIKKLTQTGGLYINNAGVALIHPFLPMLFKHTGLTVEGKFNSLHEQIQAAQILQYAATLTQQHTEQDMILSKLICGLPFSQFVPPDFELDECVTNEVRSLLAEVLKHWAILKNTSPEGLAEGFFKRTGSIKQMNDNWVLTVERKDIDILLRSLPWGISLIKSPWNDYYITVNWD